MDTATWQDLAKLRLRDAKALLEAKRWSAAYYMSGYAIECALKACATKAIAKDPGLIFRSRKFAERCWTHDIETLIEVAGLRVALDQDAKADPLLGASCAIVKDWNESARYEKKTKAQAEKLYQAIVDSKHGVMPWIKTHW